MAIKNISLGAGALKSLDKDFNSMIQNTIAGLIEKNASQATVTAKLSISLLRTATLGKDGNREESIRSEFSYKVSASISIKDKREGNLSDLGELKVMEDGSYSVDVGDEQLTICE